MSFFSPFANIITTEVVHLVPFSLSISCLHRSNKKTLQITIKDRDVLSKLDFQHSTTARVQAAVRDGVPYMTVQLVPDASGEGKLINYKTHYIIRAESLPFFPKDAHTIKTMTAFYDAKERSFLLKLPDDYKPLHDSVIGFEHVETPQPDIKDWPFILK